MNGKPTKVQPVKRDDRVRRAYGIMAEIRGTLYQRLADYVLANENRIRNETLGEESYSFCLQQMDELYLNKLGVIERAVAELGRSDQREGLTTTTTYETIEVVARREDLPQKVADALAEHGESDLLDVCVLSADEKQAEILLVLAREDTDAPAPSERAKPADDADDEDPS
ncbi:MAG: hypothetical protein KIS92_24515 [Planctomycetota bacterium]|nr:hypothetical protein [Planctomycetota bacterium]